MSNQDQRPTGRRARVVTASMLILLFPLLYRYATTADSEIEANISRLR